MKTNNPSPISAYIVEDEIKNVELLTSLLKSFCPAVQILGSSASISDSIQKLAKYRPDIIFMDIELEDGLSFDILEQLPDWNYALIFITGFHEYAIKAIRFAALDYLLKPIEVEDLKISVNRAVERIYQKVYQEQLQILSRFFTSQSMLPEKIALPSQEELNFVSVGDILKLEADGGYTSFYLRNGKRHIVSKNLKEYEELLAGDSFFRIHHSWIVNLQNVDKYVKENGGYVVMSDGSSVPVSTRRKESFLSKFKG